MSPTTLSAFKGLIRVHFLGQHVRSVQFICEQTGTGQNFDAKTLRTRSATLSLLASDTFAIPNAIERSICHPNAIERSRHLPSQMLSSARCICHPKGSRALDAFAIPNAFAIPLLSSARCICHPKCYRALDRPLHMLHGKHTRHTRKLLRNNLPCLLPINFCSADM